MRVSVSKRLTSSVHIIYKGSYQTPHPGIPMACIMAMKSCAMKTKKKAMK